MSIITCMRLEIRHAYVARNKEWRQVWAMEAIIPLEVFMRES